MGAGHGAGREVSLTGAHWSVSGHFPFARSLTLAMGAEWSVMEPRPPLLPEGCSAVSDGSRVPEGCSAVSDGATTPATAGMLLGCAVSTPLT